MTQDSFGPFPMQYISAAAELCHEKPEHLFIGACFSWQLFIEGLTLLPMNLIDTHSHLLANWDDGAESWSVAIDMLHQGEQDGIREVICTPHVESDRDMAREQLIFDLFNELKDRAHAAGIRIKIHLGAELYIQPDLDLNRKIATLAQNGTYFLLEFPMTLIPDFVADRFFEHMMDGKIPVIAHPERNAGIINDPQKAQRLVDKGALLQITAGSLLGNFGGTVRAVATRLMNENLVHVVATDAHNLTNRPLKLREAFNLVSKTWGEKRALKLFCENPRKIIHGEAIVHSIETPSKPSFWQKFSLMNKKLERYK